ncbi:Leucine rich repeat protein [Spraguea lophii 42_110]|uniref:Leucine rich repeat protein n=1 Tax=Spraguea lophii (strain 42_110) TaxID=1358809 RepID=S7XGC2_SPRLO|nr:Leucine rich repeat protein [Spraguea lophii 42_110]
MLKLILQMLTIKAYIVSSLEYINILLDDTDELLTSESPLFVELVESHVTFVFLADTYSITVRNAENEHEIPKLLGKLVKLNKLTISNCEIGKVPTYMSRFKKLRHLDLSHNKLMDFPLEILILEQLTELFLNYNQIIYIPNDLNKLQNLSLLLLDNCIIKKINFKVFDLKLLEFLNLSYNPILFRQIIHDNIFDEYILPFKSINTAHILYLDLEGNELECLPDDIALPNIIKLNLNNNKLNSLPNWFNSLKPLKHLSLNNNEFTEIPEVISNHEDLQDLRIQENKISGDIKLKHNMFPNLNLLDLSKNLITKFEILDGSLKKLTWLNLNYNRLSILDEGIMKLQYLEFLNLTANLIKYIKPNAFNTEDCINIKITVFNITFLPPIFSNPKILNIHANCLYKTDVNFDLLRYVSQNSILEFLVLSKCYLKSIPSNISIIKNLKLINFKYNRIRKVHNVFKDISKLKVIYLNHNKIHYINGSIFLLNSLIRLDLSNNRLKYLPKEINEKNNGLIVILHENNLKLRSDKISQERGQIGIIDISYKVVHGIFLDSFILTNTFIGNTEDYYNEFHNQQQLKWNIKNISKVLPNEPPKYQHDGEFILRIFNKNFKKYIIHDLERNIIIKYIKNLYGIQRHNIPIVANIPNKERDILKNYFEAIFIILLDSAKEDGAVVEQVFSAILPGMSVCVDGQLAHLSEVYYCLITKKHSIGIEYFINNFIAKYKLDVLKNITTSNEIPENIYFYIYWKKKLADELGFPSTKQLYSLEMDNAFLKCKEYILHHFFNEFNCENIIDKLVQEINNNNTLISLASHYIWNKVKNEDILDKFLIFKDIDMLDFEGIYRKGVIFLLCEMKLIFC